MKKIFLALVLTCTASAFAGKDAVVFPRVYNYGSSIQVQVWNHTDKTVTCSGSIFGRTVKGVSYSDFYFDTVTPSFTSYRSFYTRDFSDRFFSVRHNIYCY
jgi:hypothetical protein